MFQQDLSEVEAKKKLSLSQLHKNQFGSTWPSIKVHKQVKGLHQQKIAGKRVERATEEIGLKKQVMSTDDTCQDTFIHWTAITWKQCAPDQAERG